MIVSKHQTGGLARSPLVYLIILLCPFFLLVEKGNAAKLYILYPVCEEYQSASAVFTAYVTDVQKLDSKDTPAALSTGLTTVSMRIAEAFKGVKESDIVFTQKWDFETCTPNFRVGELWLVYAIRDPETSALHPKECSRTARAEFAGADLRYLRALPEIAGKTRLAGTIREVALEPGSYLYTNLANIKVTVTDQQGRSSESYADSQGVYEFVGLPAGTYKVHADLPKDLKFLGDGENDVEVRLAEHGCAEANVSVISDLDKSGAVIISEKLPSNKDGLADLYLSKKKNDQGCPTGYTILPTSIRQAKTYSPAGGRAGGVQGQIAGG